MTDIAITIRNADGDVVVITHAPVVPGVREIITIRGATYTVNNRRWHHDADNNELSATLYVV